MKDFNNMDKDIFHNKSHIEEVESNIKLNIDVSSIVSKGEELRFKLKLRKATIKFLAVASIIGIIIGAICLKLSPISITILQTIITGLLLVIYFVLLMRRSRREVNE